MKSAIALVVAAGRGSRFGRERPKQYADLDGRPVIRHALDFFAAHPLVAASRVVIHPDDQALYDAATAGLELMAPVFGGATRQESVFNGLKSLAGAAPEAVLIHDAARPILDAEVIARLLAALEEAPGALPALPVVDSLRRGDDAGRVAGEAPRENLWRAQTPQAFRFGDIFRAHEATAGAGLGDDVAVARRAGHEVVLVDGHAENIKITGPDDLELAGRWLKARRAPMETRVGQGFDVHRFEPGDHLWLGGVKIPSHASLKGHSDADVGLHALTDAILGALAHGDIGQHFPPNDPRWAGQESSVFLAHAGRLVGKAGGRILHLDLTVICEAPKVGPHRAAMAARVAEILGLAPGRVSVKATTTERLGFTGRAEGIAAQAVATLEVPAP